MNYLRSFFVFGFLSVLFLFCFANLFAQNPVFIPVDEAIPKAVVQTRQESLTAIRVTIPRLRMDQEIYDDQVFAGGFSVWDNYVLTVLHILGDQPALWSGNAHFPSVVEVFDGQNVFSAEAVFWNHSADLLLIKVKSPNQDGEEFERKPAKLAPVTYDESLNPKESCDKFFAFSFFALNPRGFFSLQTGPLFGITNTIDDNFLKIPMGILQAGVRPGFSGSPLLAPDGVVKGMISRGSNVYTYIVLAETMNSFLEISRKRITEEKKREEEKKPDPS